jgi:hypothetical protein
MAGSWARHRNWASWFSRFPLFDANAQKASSVRINYAVNNDGDYYPRLSASFTAAKTALSKINDGNYWYHKVPPNRWACEGSPNASDWIELDLAAPRGYREILRARRLETDRRSEKH